MSMGCGRYLDRCQCRAPFARTADEVALLHRAAVRRAKRAGWGWVPPPIHVIRFFFPDARESVRQAS